MPFLKNTYQNLPANSFILGWFLFGCIGLYYSRAMLSIFGVGMIVAPLLFGDIRDLWRKYKSNKAVIYLTGIFCIYLFSFFMSDNKEIWIDRINTNMLYIFIPIGFVFFGPFNKKAFHQLLYIFFLVSAFSGMLVLIEYVLHFGEYNEMYKVAKTMPTPIRHVRYGYFIALATTIGIYLLMDKSKALGKKSKILTTVISCFLFLLVHVLAVRSGLLVLYTSLLSMFLLFAIKNGAWRHLVVGLLIGVAFLFLSINIMPSLKNKIQYTLWDISRIDSKADRHLYSDVIRLASIHAGIEVGKLAPMLGVGVGDLPKEMNKQYDVYYPDFPDEARYNPISQYIFTFAAFGLIGFLVFYYCLFYSLIHGGYKDYFLVLLFSGTMLLFFIECGIELQLGKTLFLSLLCIGINRKNED